MGGGRGFGSGDSELEQEMGEEGELLASAEYEVETTGEHMWGLTWGSQMDLA